MTCAEAKRLSDPAQEALRQILYSYPLPSGRRTLYRVRLNTVRVLERSGLMGVRYADRTWEVRLTQKGIYFALLLGFRTHPEQHCVDPGLCSLHTPFERNRIPVPVLEEVR